MHLKQSMACCGTWWIIVVYANPLEEVSKTNVRLTGRIWELDDGFKGCVVLADAYHWLKVANLTADEAGEKVRAN